MDCSRELVLRDQKNFGQSYVTPLRYVIGENVRRSWRKNVRIPSDTRKDDNNGQHL